MKKFDQFKLDYDKVHSDDKIVGCFLPVHLTINKVETNLF